MTWQYAVQLDGRLRTLLRDARRLRRVRSGPAVQLWIGLEQRVRQLAGPGAATAALRSDEALEVVTDKVMEALWA